MDFQLNDEQLQLKRSVREFAEREIAPYVGKWDEAGEFPLSTIKELGKLGLMGVIFPPELGGAGMGFGDCLLGALMPYRHPVAVALNVLWWGTYFGCFGASIGALVGVFADRA